MNGRHPLGTVAQLWRYPVKSLPPEALDRVEISRDGIVGDRRRALFVTTNDHARNGKPYRGKENNLLHTVATVEGARRLAATRNVDVRERDDGPFFDAEPISIVVDRWLRELEELARMPLDAQRFRPNLYVRAAPDFKASEATLVGLTLAIGDVRLEVVSEIKRCVTTTYAVDTGEATPLIARVLAQRRDNVMGIYCRPIDHGTIALGNELSIV